MMVASLFFSVLPLAISVAAKNYHDTEPILLDSRDILDWDFEVTPSKAMMALRPRGSTLPTDPGTYEQVSFFDAVEYMYYIYACTENLYRICRSRLRNKSKETFLRSSRNFREPIYLLKFLTCSIKL
jgi:hypothetical protein